MNKEIEELLKAYGWFPIKSKNPLMKSFMKEETSMRLNFYFTTGSMQIQGDGRNDNYKMVDLSNIEEYLTETIKQKAGGGAGNYSPNISAGKGGAGGY